MNKESPAMRLVSWRLKNRDEYNRLRILGLKNSAMAIAAARRVGVDFKEKRLAERAKNPRSQKGIQNATAQNWKLRNSRGVVFYFKNLADFIRRQPCLFDDDDVRWVFRGTSEICRAYSGLSSIKPILKNGKPKKRVEGSWKGWTWVSICERRFNDGNDLLERKMIFDSINSTKH